MTRNHWFWFATLPLGQQIPRNASRIRRTVTWSSIWWKRGARFHVRIQTKFWLLIAISANVVVAWILASLLGANEPMSSKGITRNGVKTPDFLRTDLLIHCRPILNLHIIYIIISQQPWPRFEHNCNFIITSSLHRSTWTRHYIAATF